MRPCFLFLKKETKKSVVIQRSYQRLRDEAARQRVYERTPVGEVWGIGRKTVEKLAADAPLIFLYNQVDTAVVSKRLQGFAPWVASKPRLWEVSVAR